MFVHRLSSNASNADERHKIEKLKLTPHEWERARSFLKLLSHADRYQQLFSSETEPRLYAVIPSLEGLHKAWSSRADKAEYASFSNALHAACDKISKYYDKTGHSDAYVVSICTSTFF